MNITNMTIQGLLNHYKNNDFTPGQLIDVLLEKAEKLYDYNSWITLFKREQIQPYLDMLSGHTVEELPLYGIPFAIKDNIDLEHSPTTAACEEFAYFADESAYVVELLINAGAIPVGKTNLDQFATGLVGTRSPYGATKNSFKPEYISGGSSSGSAVVVAQGLVSFALGTDTAGSGRVPAAFNNIIGMKPTRGLLSNRGVYPACKSLDCVAIFATTAQDIVTLMNVAVEHDSLDPYSRINPDSNRIIPSYQKSFTFAVPKVEQLENFGNKQYEALFYDAIQHLEKLGGTRIEIDYSAFSNAAKLLYEGPWVTERYLACENILTNQPDALLDVTRKIIEPGKDKLATDVFRSEYKLNACKQMTDEILSKCDFMLTPTAGTIYTIKQVNDEPVTLNSNLGYYTNYMNLLDYASIAIPAGFASDGLPFGVTLVSTAFSDNRLIGFADLIQQSLKLPLGATDYACPATTITNVATDSFMKIVVCGAHMSGLPLNWQLQDREARLIKSCQSAEKYQLFALPGGPPERPGMIRLDEGGTAIAVEVWEMPTEHFGSFLAGIPHPLGLGKVELDDGSWVTGFICESYVMKNATNISQFGGWRSYIDSLK